MATKNLILEYLQDQAVALRREYISIIDAYYYRGKLVIVSKEKMEAPKIVYKGEKIPVKMEYKEVDKEDLPKLAEGADPEASENFEAWKKRWPSADQYLKQVDEEKREEKGVKPPDPDALEAWKKRHKVQDD
jgi:hypothetical protein